MKLYAILGLLLLFAASAHAITRTSTNYTVVADVLDGGGGSASSTNYSNTGSAGGIVGVSTYPSTQTYQYTDKNGYIGQLYEVTALEVTGPGMSTTPNVDSGSTLQLSAYEVLDDASLLLLPGTSVTWSVLTSASFGITGVNSNGLASTGSISSDRVATVQGAVIAPSGSMLTNDLSISVIGQAQTISFGGLLTRSVGDGQFLLSATSTSGLPVTFTVISGPATISGDMLTVTGPGQVTVGAQAAGGNGYLPATPVRQTFQVVGSAAQFQGLGDLAGGTNFSSALGISDGGVVVAGSANEGTQVDAAIYTQAKGLVGLQLGSASISAAANGVSADGSTLVGTGNSSGNYAPFVYNTTTGVSFLGSFGALTTGTAQAVSGDGAVVVGYATTNPAPGAAVAGAQAFSWTAAGGYVPLGALGNSGGQGGGGSRADGVSADGTVIVGTSDSGYGDGSVEAFLWTESAGMQGLGALSGGGVISHALGISADGTTTVGHSVGADSNQHAVMWLGTAANPTQLAALTGDTQSAANAACGDGTILVGYNTVGGNQVATIWQNGAVQSLQSFLTSQYGLGSALSGWTLTQATSISADGFAIAGIGTLAGATQGWVVVIPRPPTISIASPAAVNEGAASVTLTITKSAGVATDVSYTIVAGSAIQVVDGVGDYDATQAVNSNPSTTVTGAVHFNTYDPTQTVTVPLSYDAAPAAGGVRTFSVTLTGASNGAIISSTAATATVTINASSSDPHRAAGPPDVAGNPAVARQPANHPHFSERRSLRDASAGKRSRLEARRRFDLASGDTLSGLTSGDFVIEFESVVNFGAATPTFVPAPSPAVATVTAGATSVRTVQYPAIASEQTGSLEVVISPDSVAENAFIEQRGQWRFLGESDSMWRDTQATIPGLPVGSYFLEFKPVPNYAPIPTQNVQVQAGNLTTVQALYDEVQAVAGALPQAVSFSALTAQSPYEFMGQLTTDIGSGSGTAIEDRVILTAAHVIFDDATMTYATGLQWQFERFAGQLEPEPLIPQGAYLADGYAAARVGAESGVGTPASQQLDAATVFFNVSAANGGGSGYLVSNSDDEWLLKARLKMLLGYPVDTAQPNDTSVVPGQPQATVAQVVNFTEMSAPYPDVYTTSQISGLAGMSGGPLCVQYDDGHYYPAGIYLGGNQQCVVRDIDSNVQDLIMFAETSSQGGANHVGGGVVFVSSMQISTGLQVGFLTVNFGSGTPSGAGWKLSSETSYHTALSTTVSVTAGVQETISFAAVAKPYVAPASYDVTVAAGETITIEADYGKIQAPVITTSTIPVGGFGLFYDAQIKASNGPTKYTVTGVVDSLGESVSGGLGALGLTLSNSGKLSGLISSAQAAGTYRLTVVASNAGGSSGARTLDLVLAPTQAVTVNIAGGGSVLMGATKISSGATLTLPQGEQVTLTATAQSPGYLFESWSSSISGATAEVQSTERSYTFTVPVLPTPPPPATFAVTATFAANPFSSLMGSYNGLLTGDADVLASRGFIGAAVTSTGSFTGTLEVGPNRYSLLGAFDDQGNFVGTFKGAARVSPVTVNFQIDLSNTVKTISGTATVNGVSLALTANRAVFSAGSPAPQALGQKVSAKYTMALPHSTGSGAPQGDGYGAVTITPTGAVHFVGTLGDGTAVSEGTVLGSIGQWPFYALLYTNTGVITGPLTATATTGVGSLGGNLDWFKPLSKAQYYPDGFTLSSGLGDAIAVQGASLGMAPLAGLTQATLAIIGGGLNPSVPAVNVMVSSKGVGTANGLKGFAFSIVPTTGVFTGKFLDEAAVSHTFNGVLLPADGGTAHGFGLFKGAPYTGKTGSLPGDTGAVEF